MQPLFFASFAVNLFYFIPGTCILINRIFFSTSFSIHYSFWFSLARSPTPSFAFYEFAVVLIFQHSHFSSRSYDSEDENVSRRRNPSALYPKPSVYSKADIQEQVNFRQYFCHNFSLLWCRCRCGVSSRGSVYSNRNNSFNHSLHACVVGSSFFLVRTFASIAYQSDS